MEDLFSTNIIVNNKNIVYHVVFDSDQYIFTSETVQKEFSSFSYKRELDEWHAEKSLTSEIKNQAVNALEKYLLKQH